MNFKELVSQGKKIVSDILNVNKKVILYGKGSIGNFVYGALSSDVPMEAYCISGEVKTNEMFNGLPVYSIHEFPYPVEECLFLLTVDARHWEAVQKTLENVGAKHVLPLSVEHQNAILALFYERFFDEKKVDLEQEILDLDGIKIANPFKLDGVDLDAVLIEMNDLILGDIYKDHRLLSEGPYLYHNSQLSEGDVVFDCGANLGLFSCVAAAKGCTSYAFEPTKRLCDRLEIYQDIYGGNIIPVNVALSNENGETEFFMSDKWDVANTIVLDENNSVAELDREYKSVMVKTMTIDSFVEENHLESVDYIKADIEGAERYMLMGAKETLKKFAPKLSICTYHFPDDPEVLEKIILESNPAYKVVHKWKKLYATVE